MIIRARVKRRTLHVWAAAVLYASVITFFPWDLVRRQGFRDFTRYVEEFESRPAVRPPAGAGVDVVALYVSREVLWDTVVRGLMSVTGSAVGALRVITFFTALVWSVFLFSRIPIHWGFIFLLSPTTIDLALSIIRNAFGWSLVILALATASRVARYALLVCAPFVHTSSLAVVALFAWSRAVIPRIRSGTATAIAALAPGVAIALALTVFNEMVLGALGDRRTGEDYVRGGGSVLQSAYWVIVLGVQLGQGSGYVRRHALVIGMLAWYLVMNPFIPWSYRVWGAFMPVIAASIWDLDPRRRQLLKYMWLAYIMIWYMYWTKLFDVWYPLVFG